MEEARHYIDRMRSRPPDEAIPKLIELLRDESWYLRERAGEALAGFGQSAAPPVEQLLESGLWYSRAAALGVLGKIAAPRSLHRIIDSLNDDNRTIVEAALKALLDYCRQDRALAVAKILHGRGGDFRERVLGLMLRLHPEDAPRLRRLVEAGDFMGPEGALDEADERRLAESVSDEPWGIAWKNLDATETLPEPPENLVRYLRGSITP